MFTFFHGYLPKLWDAQVKAGLVREQDGLRFCQCIMQKDEQKFNALAAKGGELYNIIAEQKRPFYIDRLQGGVFIDEYPYDKELLAEYKSLLGDKFWGFQMHEWMSNYYHDAFHKLGNLPEEQWTKEGIEKFVKENFPYKYSILESMTAEEMANAGKPKTVEEFYGNMTAIYKKRLSIGELIPCDSVYLAYGFELSTGATKLMPEVGAQCTDMRLQVSYARGMTRKEGRSFGIYYEPWGGNPFSVCCYNKENKNEWGIGDSADFPFQSQGADGGSSRSLQKRVFLYGYLSNASFMSEEWGLANVFNSWEEFGLSPYGITKKEFIDFVNKYDDIGEKLTPIAAVLPKDLMVLDNVYSDDIYCGFKTDSKKIANLKQGLRAIFTTSLPMSGTEVITLKNSDVPDAIDALNYDEEMLEKYDYLVDLTSDTELSEKYNNVCRIEDLKEILREKLPCYVEGNAHWMVNKCTSGGYYLTIFNHSGICRSVAGGETKLAEAATTVSLDAKVVPVMLEGDGEMVEKAGKYFVNIPAGGFAFIRLR